MNFINKLNINIEDENKTFKKYQVLSMELEDNKQSLVSSMVVFLKTKETVKSIYINGFKFMLLLTSNYDYSDIILECKKYAENHIVTLHNVSYYLKDQKRKNELLHLLIQGIMYQENVPLYHDFIIPYSVQITKDKKIWNVLCEVISLDAQNNLNISSNSFYPGFRFTKKEELEQFTNNYFSVAYQFDIHTTPIQILDVVPFTYPTSSKWDNYFFRHVPKNIDSRASSIPFLDLDYTSSGKKKRSTSYLSCRNHLYWDFIEQLNILYKNDFVFSYDKIENKYEEIALNNYSKTKIIKHIKNTLFEFYANKKIALISTDSNEHKINREFKQKLEKYLKDLYVNQIEKMPKIVSCTEEAEYVFALVHESEYYYKRNDSYYDFLDDVKPVQHITYNTCQSNGIDDIIQKCLIEMIIKDDIKKEKCHFEQHLFKKGFESVNTIDFVMVSNQNNKKLYTRCRIYLPSMKMKIYDPCSDKELPDFIFSAFFIEGFGLDNNHNFSSDYYIFENKSTCFSLTKTNQIIILDEKPLLQKINELEDEKTAKNTKSIRTKENYHLINSMQNIHMFKQGTGKDSIYYIQSGCNTAWAKRKLQNASHLYQIDGNIPISLIPKQISKYIGLVETSMITAVHQFTVLPFPFKYVKEYYDFWCKKNVSINGKDKQKI